MLMDWEISPVSRHPSPPGRAESSSIDDAIEIVASGGMIIVVDDNDRENEGDLIASAATITPEIIAFMVNHSTGILCASMSDKHADALALPPMVARNDDPQATAFTVTCDAKASGTGVSAKDRALSFHVLAKPTPDPALLRRPGHIFPLRARRGGVFVRQGHTEAAYDIIRLAGHTPVGVLCELVNPDGSMMSGVRLDEFARKYGLLKVSVGQLIDWRRTNKDI
jgi:3,4-dihydroxy 2-butanone 4-phosphate synthase/GTP cyclohydrolase II